MSNKPYCKNPHRIDVSFIVLIMACFFVSCFAVPPVSPDTLRTPFPLEPPTLNPIFVQDGFSQAVSAYVFESLLSFDNKTQQLKGQLAESYEVLPDKKTYRFFLRKNVLWHDGVRFTADDVMASVAVLAQPDANALYKFVFSQIEDVRKIDEYTVEFVYKAVYFRGLIHCGSIPILPKHILQKNADSLPQLFRRDAIGTGPFVFSRWDNGARLVLSRNENYWGEKPGIRSLELHFISDQSLAFQKLKKGELDLIDDLREVQWLRQTNSQAFTKKFNKFSFASSAYGCIAWNNQNRFFADKRVRQAMTHLLNRQLILEKLKHGMGRVVTGPFHPDSPSYNPDAKDFAYDVAKALALLNDAGIRDSDHDGWLDKDGEKFSFTLLVNTVPFVRRLSSIYQQDLQKVGIDMQLAQLDNSLLLDRTYKKDFDAVIFKWPIGRDADIAYIWHSAMTDVAGGYNFISYKNAEVDALLDAAQSEFSTQARNAIYRKVHALIAEDQPYTFLFVDDYLMALAKRFDNVIMYPGGYDLLEWRVNATQGL